MNNEKIKLLIIALLPACIFGVYNFGFMALLQMLVCVGTAVLTEYIYGRIKKEKNTISDWSAVLTGLLLAMNLPPNFPWYLAALGTVFSMVIIKLAFGGIGKNFINPAMGAKCFLLLSFSGKMSHYMYNGVTTVTPLEQMHAGESINTMDLFLGTTAGNIGETSILCLLIGVLFLIVMDVIDTDIPLMYLGVFVVFMAVFAKDPAGMNRFHTVCAHLGSGSLMLGAWFMAIDPATSPKSKSGRMLFGAFLGLMTGLFRVCSTDLDGVCFTIVLGNLLVPFFEKAGQWKPLRKGGEVA